MRPPTIDGFIPVALMWAIVATGAITILGFIYKGIQLARKALVRWWRRRQLSRPSRPSYGSQLAWKGEHVPWWMFWHHGTGILGGVIMGLIACVVIIVARLAGII